MNSENNSCPICFCDIVNKIDIECNHPICLFCFLKSKKEKYYNCCICRKKIDLNNNEIKKESKEPEIANISDIVFELSEYKYRNENKNIKMIFKFEILNGVAKEYYYKKMLKDNINLSDIKEYYDILKVNYDSEIKILFDLDKHIKKNLIIFINGFLSNKITYNQEYYARINKNETIIDIDILLKIDFSFKRENEDGKEIFTYNLHLIY